MVLVNHYIIDFNLWPISNIIADASVQHTVLSWSSSSSTWFIRHGRQWSCRCFHSKMSSRCDINVAIVSSRIRQHIDWRDSGPAFYYVQKKLRSFRRFDYRTITIDNFPLFCRCSNLPYIIYFFIFVFETINVCIGSPQPLLSFIRVIIWVLNGFSLLIVTKAAISKISLCSSPLWWWFTHTSIFIAQHIVQ